MVALDTVGAHMKRLQHGDHRIQAAETKDVNETTYIVYFAKSDLGVRSRTNYIHNNDKDVRTNLVGWVDYKTMLANSIYYQGVEDALLGEITVKEMKGGGMASASMKWIATVVPSGKVKELEWHDHPTGDPTKLEKD